MKNQLYWHMTSFYEEIHNQLQKIKLKAFTLEARLKHGFKRHA